MFNLKMIKMKTFTKEQTAELNTLKEALKKYRKLGTVKEWNVLRDEAKEHYDQEIISALDASGYISEWMKGN